MNQKLWPQCQKCFRTQGHAVKEQAKNYFGIFKKHPLVFHHGFRLFHCTPLLSNLLDKNDGVRAVLFPIAEKLDKKATAILKTL